MKPALNAEEWADPNKAMAYRDGSCFIGEYEGVIHVDCDDSYYGATWTPETRHAAAAVCLHGQEYGFTREDVRRHRAMAGGARETLEKHKNPPTSGAACLAWQRAIDHGHERIEWHESMADRIEALLPPEG